MRGVLHRPDFDDQRPHAGGSLERHHGRSDFIAIKEWRRARHAGINEVRSVREKQAGRSSVQPMWPEAIRDHLLVLPEVKHLPMCDIIAQGAGLDWYTRHHADRLHAPHSGEAASNSGLGNPERSERDYG
jgi:hypothetical protein